MLNMEERVQVMKLAQELVDSIMGKGEVDVEPNSAYEELMLELLRRR